MTEHDERILVKSSSSKNGMTTLFAGVLALLLGGILMDAFKQTLLLPAVFVVSAGIVAVIVGAYKLSEPKYSFELTKESITYINKRGSWSVPWSNIQRVDIPTITVGVESQPLDYIGIRIKNPEDFLHAIPQRLSAYILMEQRALLAKSMQEHCNTGTCIGNDVIEDTKYKLSDGTLINGVKAMFAHRLDKSAEYLGYQILISTSELDRPAADFVVLLRQCMDTVRTENAH